MPISCDDLARVLEKREPGDRSSPAGWNDRLWNCVPVWSAGRWAWWLGSRPGWSAVASHSRSRRSPGS
jgi:hypothetical protein